MDSDRRVCTIHKVPSQGDAFAISTPDAPSPTLWDPYVLVGMGDPGINCGKIHQGEQCPNCCHHYPGVSQCNQKQCPNCYNNWINKTTRKKYARLTDPRNVQQNRYKRFNHIPISIDPKLVNQLMKEEITEQQIRKMAISYLKQKSPVVIYRTKPIDKHEIEHLEKEYGFTVIPHTNNKAMSISKEKWDRLEKKEGKKSLRWRKKMGYNKPLIITLIRRTFFVKFQQPDGTMDYHPYRFNDYGKNEYNKYVAEMKNNDAPNKEILKKWDWLRQTHPQDYKKYIEFSPHFHFNGWNGHLAPARKGELFVYEKKPGLSYITNDIITKEQKKQENLLVIHINKQTKMVIKKLDLIRAIRYPLTHTVDRTDTKNYSSYVWIGKLSTRNGKTDKEEQLENYQQIIKINEENTEEKHTCKNCGATLGRTKPVVEHFFNKYEKITNIGWYTYPDLISMVQKNKHITEEQRRNMTETLKTLQNCNIRLGKPPP